MLNLYLILTSHSAGSSLSNAVTPQFPILNPTFYILHFTFYILHPAFYLLILCSIYHIQHLVDGADLCLMEVAVAFVFHFGSHFL